MQDGNNDEVDPEAEGEGDSGAILPETPLHDEVLLEHTASNLAGQARTESRASEACKRLHTEICIVFSLDSHDYVMTGV